MRRSRLLSPSVLPLISPLLFACASGGVTTGEDIRAEMNLPDYSGPRATIAVGSCEDKSGGATNFTVGDGDQQIQYAFTREVGHGMAEMLVTGLLNTERFRVFETGDLAALEREQAYRGETASDRMQAADLVVSCAVTSVEPNAGGVGGGVLSALGSAVGVGGAGLKKSSVTLDIRLIDTGTREILTAFEANGTATDAGVVGILGGTTTAGILGGYSNTPIEGAVKKAILKTSEHLALNTPRRYFVEATGGDRPHTEEGGDAAGVSDPVDEGEGDLASQYQQQEGGSPRGDE